jgi:hypothetical protein
MLLLGVALFALSLPWTLKAEESRQQDLLLINLDPSYQETGYREHIAIIGAGIGGASTAFNIHEYNRNLSPQKVTIFESESTVGGRIKSVYLYPGKGALKLIEDGATHFYTDDLCLTSAVRDVGLKIKPPPWPMYNRIDEDIGRISSATQSLRTGRIICMEDGNTVVHGVYSILRSSPTWKIGIHLALMATPGSITSWTNYTMSVSMRLSTALR